MQNPENYKLYNSEYNEFLLGDGQLDKFTVINYENNLSIDNYSCIEYEILYQIICLIAIINTTGGNCSYLMNEIPMFDRRKVLALYSQMLAKRTLKLDVTVSYDQIIIWCYQHQLISELEANRLVSNSNFNFDKTIEVDCFNEIILTKGLENYVKDYI
ncbi:MAG: hypothetical protein ACRCSS_18235 [Shewanella sp.]